jgi:hypothetical protein
MILLAPAGMPLPRKQRLASVRNYVLSILFAGVCWAMPASDCPAADGATQTSRWSDPLYYYDLLGRRPPEILEMVTAIARGSPMGPGGGWFHPSQTRYDWGWLSARFDLDHNGSISRQEFPSSAEYFERLDRNHDGVLTASDFDWLDRSASPQEKGAPPRSNGGPTPGILLRGLFNGELGSLREGPAVRQQAPDFVLRTHDGKRSIGLAQFRGKKPVVLVFGSFT